MVLLYGVSFLVFYFYISLLQLIPRWFASQSMFVFVSIVYSVILYKVIYEFESFDVLNQHIIIVFSFFFVIALYTFKFQIKYIFSADLMKYSIQIISILSIHICLYDKYMSDVSIFLYYLSFTHIFLDYFVQYIKIIIALQTID